MATARGFEWFVAWRHLRDPERRTRRALVAGLVIVALGALAIGIAYILERQSPSSTMALWQPRPPRYVQHVRLGGIIAVILGAVVAYLGLLLASFTVFTAISIFGVFLGTAAPILALSIMSGFEADLKGKIRGAKADVVITRAEEAPFRDEEEVRRKIAGIPGLVAATPYLETEVMLQAGGTPAGVLMRGVDPETATGVLDLRRTLREGKVEDLARPEAVAPPPRRPLPSLELRPEPATDNAKAGSDPGTKSLSRGIKPAPAPANAAPRAKGPKGKSREPAPTPAAAAPAAPPAEPPAVVEPAGPPMPTILLGEELYSRNLRVFVGGEVDVVCPLCGTGPTGARPKLRSFRVAGHFYSGMYEYDSKLVYVGLREAQRFMETPGEVTGIDVRTASPEVAADVAAAIQQRVGSAYEVRTWEELNRSLFMALRLEKIAMFIVLTFIALVASFSIVSNLIMMVTQKGREVAILKAMGAGDAAIRRVFFAEGLYIGLLGLTVGVGCGVAGCLLIKRFGLPLPADVYYINQLPVLMRAGEIGTVAAVALLMCCLATIYPAVMASRMRPVDGLRYE